MSDNTRQGGIDVLATEHVSKLNDTVIVPADDTPKVQQVLVGYSSAPNEYRDVSPAYGLPIAQGQSADIVSVVNSVASATTPLVIDTTGYRWVSMQMSAGYGGMTGLTAQTSADGINWFSMVLCQPSQSQSGLTNALGTSLSVWHGPTYMRYIRFLPAGTWASGTLTLLIRLHTMPLWMNSSGVSANVSNMIVRSITIGTGSSQAFYARVTGAGLQALTNLLNGVANLAIYVTDISWANSGTNDTVLTLAASSAPAGGQDLILKAGSSDIRSFPILPWKISQTTNIALQYAISAAVTGGSWFLTVHGFYG